MDMKRVVFSQDRKPKAATSARGLSTALPGLIAMLAAGTWASAAPVAMGFEPGGSFTQQWMNHNPDSVFGQFDAIALEIAQEGTSPDVTAPLGFKDVSIVGDGWSVTSETDWLVMAESESSGESVTFDLEFFGTGDETVNWNIWYYQQGVALGGFQHQGMGDQSDFSFVQLSGDQAASPMVPLPSAAGLAAAALVGGAGLRRRRAMR